MDVSFHSPHVQLLGNALLTSPFLFRSRDYANIFRILGYFTLGACLAFFLEVAEFAVIFFSSSLTLSIAGIVKVRTPDFPCIYHRQQIIVLVWQT